MKLSEIESQPQTQKPTTTAAPLKLSEVENSTAKQELTEQPGIADRLWEALKFGVTEAPGVTFQQVAGLVEPMAAIGTGMYSEPFSGVAGLAGAVLPGDPGQGAQMVKEVGRATQYQPRTQGGQQAMQGIASFLGPLARLFERGQQRAGNVAFEATGPVAGAVTEGLVHIIPDLLGLKGTQAAKKALLQKAVAGKDIAELYDDLGNLLPEIKKSVEESGLAKADIEKIIPQVIPEKIKEIKTEAPVAMAADISAQIDKKIPSESIAEKVQPSKEILDAAKELGLENQLLPSHYSQNPVYIEIEQGLKSIPGSQLSASEKALVSELSKKADEIITEFGGQIDKSGLSDAFKINSTKLVTDLENVAENLYAKVDELIPPKTAAPANNTIAKINGYADELGGAQYLNAQEKRLLKNLNPESMPTYARLDRIRKEIGEGLRNQGPFKDSEKGMLKDLYGSLLADQKAVAATQGDDVLKLYELASNSIVERKAIEKQLQAVLGKEVTGNVMTKAKPALLNLQKGDTKSFDDLLKNIPDQLGPEAKKEIVITALNDAFTQGSRKERSLSIPGFTDFMSGINRNPAAKRRLRETIGEEAAKRLDLFNTVVSGVRRAQEQSITTGRIMAVPKLFDEQEGMLARLYGITKQVAKAEGASTSIGMPGAGLTGVIASGLSATKKARSIKADELLASHQFRNLIRAAAENKINTKTKIEKAEQTLNQIKAYQEWKKTVPKATAADLAVLGGIEYLLGIEKED